ncbi:dsDNA nuclease domain-containing protein [Bacillus sp. SD088]|uniref:dsDNA nuclease domain-containing protein n=1 Tax=Bacillus sp. SD088 TaxID=2782012 RepID=UPI001A9791CB|nr:dsDNA nuclease domain-containing protein [Bacillus sp. SD088]MBO0995683.1 DUF4297 domain-containing protein [Bacillus sp. SD088]
MKNILGSELREQAGSDSYNRFDYQAHWIVYHMINEYKMNTEFFIFCEFHDDMAKTTLSSNPDCAEFFQIKTTELYKEWTLSRLTKTTKKSNGGVKHSFLGFIFYNFLKFEDECSKCHFVSNIKMDKQISSWQAIIEDEKSLKKEDESIYKEIRNSLRKEYKDLEQVKFDFVFDKFIQNTFIYHGDLPLENYDKVVAGEFFHMLDNKEIFTSNSNKILRDIIEEVRKKSKKKIAMPISYKSLKEAKGISSSIFTKLKEQINTTPHNSEMYDQIEEFLGDNDYPVQQCRLIVRQLKKHHMRMLDINNSLYQDTTNKVLEIIDTTLEENYDKISDLKFLSKNVHANCEGALFEDSNFNKVLVEALLYERLLSTG